MVKELLEKYLSHLDSFRRENSSMGVINKIIFLIYKSDEGKVKIGSPLRSNYPNGLESDLALEDAIRYIGIRSYERDVQIELWAQDYHDKKDGLVKIGIGVKSDEHFNEIYRRLNKKSGSIENRITNPYQFDFKLK